MTRTVILGEQNKKFNPHNFEGATLKAIFGGLTLDFKDCTLTNTKTILDVTAVCGGISLTIPKEWNIKTEIEPIIMGGISDMPGANIDLTTELIISGEIVMGGIEIKRV